MSFSQYLAGYEYLASIQDQIKTDYQHMRGRLNVEQHNTSTATTAISSY